MQCVFKVAGSWPEKSSFHPSGAHRKKGEGDGANVQEKTKNAAQESVHRRSCRRQKEPLCWIAATKAPEGKNKRQVEVAAANKEIGRSEKKGRSQVKLRRFLEGRAERGETNVSRHLSDLR